MVQPGRAIHSDTPLRGAELAEELVGRHTVRPNLDLVAALEVLKTEAEGGELFLVLALAVQGLDDGGQFPRRAPVCSRM